MSLHYEFAVLIDAIQSNCTQEELATMTTSTYGAFMSQTDALHQKFLTHILPAHPKIVARFAQYGIEHPDELFRICVTAFFIKCKEQAISNIYPMFQSGHSNV